MSDELIITSQDIALLKEMKRNCLKADVYEDENRLLKANAITKFLMLLEENQKYKEVFDKAIKNSQKWLNTYSKLNTDNDVLICRLEENIKILKGEK